MRSSRPGATSRLTVLAVGALAAGCAAGAYGDNFGAESGDFANSSSSSSGSLGAGTDNGGSALSGSFGGAAAGSGGGYDAGSGRDNAIDAAGGDASSAASDGGQAESGGPLSTGLSILYKVEVQQATSAYVGCQLSVTNSGTGAPQVSALRARYYFTDEVHLTPQLKINWSHISTSGPNTDVTVTYAFAPVVPAAPGADTYIEFSFSSAHPLLGPGESAVFSWQMQGPDPSKNLYTQTNDYSFDSSKTSLASWDHVLLLQNGSVVWGRSP